MFSTVLLGVVLISLYYWYESSDDFQDFVSLSCYGLAVCGAVYNTVTHMETVSWCPDPHVDDFSGEPHDALCAAYFKGVEESNAVLALIICTSIMIHSFSLHRRKCLNKGEVIDWQFSDKVGGLKSFVKPSEARRFKTVVLHRLDIDLPAGAVPVNDVAKSRVCKGRLEKHLFTHEFCTVKFSTLLVLFSTETFWTFSAKCCSPAIKMTFLNGECDYEIKSLAEQIKAYNVLLTIFVLVCLYGLCVKLVFYYNFIFLRWGVAIANWVTHKGESSLTYAAIFAALAALAAITPGFTILNMTFYKAEVKDEEHDDLAVRVLGNRDKVVWLYLPHYSNLAKDYWRTDTKTLICNSKAKPDFDNVATYKAKFVICQSAITERCAKLKRDESN